MIYNQLIFRYVFDYFCFYFMCTYNEVCNTYYDIDNILVNLNEKK